MNSNTILASSKDGKFTTNDLLSYLRNSNPKLFIDNPIRTFYMCLRDKILTDEGRRLGLLNRKKVQRKIKSAEDQFLARAFLLNTLPKKELLSGYAEVVKYGLINDRSFFNWLNKNIHDNLSLVPKNIVKII